MFLHDDVVCAIGERGTGVDPHRLALPDRPGEPLASGRGADQPQDRLVAVTHRIAIHRRHRAARRIEAGGDGTGEHAAGRFGER